MTVEEMLSKVSSAELTYWAAYYQLEPFGPEVEHHMDAQIAYILASVNASKGKKFKLEDFMPRSDAAKQQTPDQQKKMFQSLFGIK